MPGKRGNRLTKLLKLDSTLPKLEPLRRPSRTRHPGDDRVRKAARAAIPGVNGHTHIRWPESARDFPGGLQVRVYVTPDGSIEIEGVYDPWENALYVWEFIDR